MIFRPILLSRSPKGLNELSFKSLDLLFSQMCIWQEKFESVMSLLGSRWCLALNNSTMNSLQQYFCPWLYSQWILVKTAFASFLVWSCTNLFHSLFFYPSLPLTYLQTQFSCSCIFQLKTDIPLTSVYTFMNLNKTKNVSKALYTPSNRRQFSI